MDNWMLVQKLEHALTEIRWQGLGDGYEYWYAEDRLYVIHDILLNAYYFVRARSPQQAKEQVWKRRLNLSTIAQTAAN